jgi:hypothetical protein
MRKGIRCEEYVETSSLPRDAIPKSHMVLFVRCAGKYGCMSWLNETEYMNLHSGWPRKPKGMYMSCKGQQSPDFVVGKGR